MSNTPSDAEIEKLAAEHLKAFAQFTGAGDVWVEGEVAFARAVLAKWGTPQPVVREPELDQFLSDVMTAAGLVTHGKQCKQLGERLGAAVMKLRAHGIPQKGGS